MRGEDRLSTLGDDLLRRILYFVPAKEAASTCVLSRRWGSLWRSTGAVNLVVRVPDDGTRIYKDSGRRKKEEKAFFSYRNAFLRAADAILNAAEAPITRLTLHLEGNRKEVYNRFVHYRSRRWDDDHDDVVGAVVSHRAARHVEELHIAAVDDSEKCFDFETSGGGSGVYTIHSLPSETLRVLELTNCASLKLPASVAFPRLATLRLRFCYVETMVIQALIDAAPELATVHLDSVHLLGHNSTADEAHTLSLRCKSVTTFAMALCKYEGRKSWRGIQIEAPRLRSFTYKGIPRSFVLRTPAPDMVHMDLHFLEGSSYHGIDEDKTRILFWQFVKNFSNAKVLKMKVNNLVQIAARGKASRAEHLCSFPNVESLELEGVYDPTSRTDAVAIGNLLRCCPALRDLRLKLSTVASDIVKNHSYALPFLKRKDRLDYERSLDRFMRRRSSDPTISMDDQCDEVSDIPGLRGRSFTCLQTSLRRVGLQFRLDGSNCLGVQLIKFFAENAMVLEEISVDSGNRRLMEHMSLDIERWMSPNSTKVRFKSRKFDESSWEFSRITKVSTDSAIDLKTSTSSGFTVTPLQR